MPTKRTTKRKEADSLTGAHMILQDATERRENSDLYRWAQLVVKRHEAGRSIADAEKWLGEIMAGMDMGYLEWESMPGRAVRVAAKVRSAKPQAKRAGRKPKGA